MSNFILPKSKKQAEMQHYTPDRNSSGR